MASPFAVGELPAQDRVEAGGFRRHRRFLARVHVVAAVAVGLLCLWLAIGMRSLLPGAKRPMNGATIWVCLGLLALALGIATVSRRGEVVRGRSRTMVLAVTAAAALVLAVLFVFRSLGNGVSRPTVLFFAVLAAAALGGWDAYGVRWLWRGADQRRRFVALIGSSSRLAVLSPHLDSGPWRLAAAMDDACENEDAVEDKLNQLREVIRGRPVDEIVLAASVLEGDPQSARFYRGVIDICEQTGMKLHVLSDWLSEYRQVQVDQVSDRPVLSFSFSPTSPWALLCKRFLDISISAVMLIVLSPLLLMVAIAIRLEGPGPVLFRQTRVGLRGRSFTIYKFRSMIANAEALRPGLTDANEMLGPIFKISADPRLTRIGGWLRKTSLDELPQLWNVLRGDMSLVGPRPPLPAEVRQYRLGSLRRLAMKPGMTGLWQVSGRSNIRDFEEWVRMDASYIRNWSLLGDCKILLRTFGTVLRMEGK